MAKVRQGAEVKDDGLKERVVAVNRVTKVVKGGRVLGFAVLAVVGDGAGKVGYGKGKAREVSSASQKAMENARTNMVMIRMADKSLYHTVFGKHGAATVRIAPGLEGSGMIAGGPVRAVFEVAGITDVVAKAHGSTNPYNMVRATMDGLLRVESPADVAARRGISEESVAISRK